MCKDLPFICKEIQVLQLVGFDWHCGIVGTSLVGVHTYPNMGVGVYTYPNIWIPIKGIPTKNKTIFWFY